MTFQKSWASDSVPLLHSLSVPVAFTICMFIVLFFAESAFAAPPLFGQKKKYNNDNEFVPETLQQPPDLPFLPPYSPPPSKYDSILAFKRKPDGPGYTVSFHVKESPEEVVEFYKSAVKNNHWESQKSGDSSRMVSGIRKGAMFTVTVLKPYRSGFKSQVYLVYKISGKPR